MADGAWFDSLLQTSGFLRRHPHFAGMIAAMEPVATDAVETMAVALHCPDASRTVMRLYINRDYFREHPGFLAGILRHELQHVVFGHISDPKFHVALEPRLMELAMETSANEGIDDPLPAGAIRHQDFAEFGVAAGQSTLVRYDVLCRAHKEGRLQVVDERQLDLMDPRWRSRLPPEDAARRGPRILILPPKRRLPWRRSPRILSPGRVDDHRPGRRSGAGDAGLGDALDRRSDEGRARTWARGEAGPPTEDSLLADWWRRIRAHLGGERGGGDSRRGTAPVAKELDREIAREETGHLSWPRILAELLPRRRAVVPTYLVPNRRFPARVGEVPGRCRRPPRPAILAGIDTSASMSATDLGRIAPELARLARSTRITVAECDAAVQRVHCDPHPEAVRGGGDTDFHPIFALAAARGREFEGVICFTDGKGPWPSDPPALPVLWVLVNDHPFDCPWGLVVRV